MHHETDKVCIEVVDQDRLEEAERFISTYGFSYCDKECTSPLRLRFESDHLQLFDTELNTGIHVDFVCGTLAHRERFGGGKGQAIAKAIGLNKLDTPTVLDVTSGLARDAYVLATLGCQMTLVEQSPALFLLVRDGIGRALTATEPGSISNFKDHILGNSIPHLQQLDEQQYPDVIYMDPMYPTRRKSALVKKDMQILHKLIGASDDEADLLKVALTRARHRVVVKRPTQAETVGNRSPSYQIESKKTRYDIYTCT